MDCYKAHTNLKRSLYEDSLTGGFSALEVDMTHSPPFDADVAIIGYGPSGVVAANALGGQYGISAIALEREVDIYPPRARAVTVHEWTMRCLQSLGLDEEVKKDTDVSRALRWITYDGQELMRMNSLPGNLGHEQAYAIYQPLLEETLRKGVERYEQVSVRYGNEVTAVDQDAEGVTVTMRSLGSGETSTIRTKYALACDGGSSFTRKYLDVPLEGGKPCPCVGSSSTQRSSGGGPTATSSPSGPTPSDLSWTSPSAVATTGGRCRSRPTRPMRTSTARTRCGHCWKPSGVTHEDVDLHQWAFYNHNVRFAKDWRVGRVFLVGDAAHLMPPWAGAGMQSGMRDSFNLAWKLREVIQGRLPSGLLDSYQPEREPNVRFYTDLSVQMGRLVKQEMSPEEMAAMAPKPGGELPPMLLPPFYVDGWFSATPTPESAVGKMIPPAARRGGSSWRDRLAGRPSWQWIRATGRRDRPG